MSPHPRISFAAAATAMSFASSLAPLTFPPPPSLPAPRYAARCSLRLSAGLDIAVSRFDCAAAPNPFRVDFERLLSALCTAVHSKATLLAADPRNYSYVALALYRLLRHLIPPTDAVVAAAAAADPTSHAAADVSPPSAPPGSDVALVVARGRIDELFTGELRRHALVECDKCERGEQKTGSLIFTAAAFGQPILAVDAAEDEERLSAWQRWLVHSTAWQTLAGTLVEYFAAELIELLGNALKDGCCAADEDTDGDDERSSKTRPRPRHCRPLHLLHKQVLANDEELSDLWHAIGMPAQCPASVDVDRRTTYRHQFERQMRAAVTASAPWMFDAQQVQQRVAAWMAGRLPSGDGVFFRRYHIRPLHHSGLVIPLLDSKEKALQHDPLTFSLQATFDLVDAAGVSRSLIIACGVRLDVNVLKQRYLHVAVSSACNEDLSAVLLGTQYSESEHKASKEQDANQLYARSELCFVQRHHISYSKDSPLDPFDDYVCHGHLHGLSEQQWDEAMGGRLRISYYSGDAAESKRERADDDQAAVSKDGMFPARLADVADRSRYRCLQRAEIRRAAAIATRLVVLDEGVDVAVFPCFQPSELRRQFEAALRTPLDSEIAQLRARLPALLQEVELYYALPPIDIPL